MKTAALLTTLPFLIAASPLLPRAASPGVSALHCFTNSTGRSTRVDISHIQHMLADYSTNERARQFEVEPGRPNIWTHGEDGRGSYMKMSMNDGPGKALTLTMADVDRLTGAIFADKACNDGETVGGKLLFPSFPTHVWC
jgi:hypothetical protein